MDKPINLESVRASKIEPCPYCGESPHKVPLACPRIAYIVAYEDNEQVEIHFWPDDEPVAPDAA